MIARFFGKLAALQFPGTVIPAKAGIQYASARPSAQLRTRRVTTFGGSSGQLVDPGSLTRRQRRYLRGLRRARAVGGSAVLDVGGLVGSLEHGNFRRFDH